MTISSTRFKETDARDLFYLYRNYLENSGHRNFYNYNSFSSVDTCPYDWPSLDVQIRLEDIQKIAKDTGIIQLRPIDQAARVLVVGCGNYPIAISGGAPIDKGSAYSQKHAHKGAVTINPDLASNPTIIAFFGEHRFPMLRDRQFDLVIMEGTAISDTSTGREELNRLLSPTGRVVSDLGDRIGREFTWEDNSANIWSPSYSPPPIVIPKLPEPESYLQESGLIEHSGTSAVSLAEEQDLKMMGELQISPPNSMTVDRSEPQVKQNRLTQQEADYLFAIYANYIKQNNTTNVDFDGFESTDKCCFNWPELNVEFPARMIDQLNQETGVIQLRSIDPKAKVLVIGCGNRPIADSGGRPISQDDPYSKLHAHEGAVTINPDLAANPTIVAFFGKHHFPMLRDHQFDLIIIEGTAISDTSVGRNEVERLLSKTGQIVNDYGDHVGHAFSWGKNQEDFWGEDYILAHVAIPKLPGPATYLNPDEISHA